MIFSFGLFSFTPANGWELSGHHRHYPPARMATQDNKLLPSIEEMQKNIRAQGFHFTVDATRAYGTSLDPGSNRRGSFPCSIEDRRLLATRPAVHLPLRFYWRDEDKVTPVQDQHPCQLCWAFAAVAELESKILLHEDMSYDLSEQQLASCDFLAASGKARSCSSGGSSLRAVNFLTQRGACA